MMSELGEYAPVYSILPYIKNYIIVKKIFVSPFGFRKEKTENYSHQLKINYKYFFKSIYSIQGTEEKNPI